jgi:hypothetical protein
LAAKSKAKGKLQKAKVKSNVRPNILLQKRFPTLNYRGLKEQGEINATGQENKEPKLQLANAEILFSAAASNLVLGLVVACLPAVWTVILAVFGKAKPVIRLAQRAILNARAQLLGLVTG